MAKSGGGIRPNPAQRAAFDNLKKSAKNNSVTMSAPVYYKGGYIITATRDGETRRVEVDTDGWISWR